MFDVTDNLRKERIKNMMQESLQSINYIHMADQKQVQFKDEEKDELVTIPIHNIKITKKKKKKELAHIYWKENPNRIILGIHPTNWNTKTGVNRFITICHEITHLSYPHHRKDFWDEMTLNLIEMIKDRERLVEHFVKEKRMDKATKKSLPIFDISMEFVRNIKLNCRDQTSMNEEEIEALIDEIHDNKLRKFFNQNPVLAEEWQRQYRYNNEKN